MSRETIVRMWGYADAYELIFSKLPSGDWAASVPPDMEDGQYAVEIHAQDENDKTCMWTGILYMNLGKHWLCINKRKYTFWLKPPVLSVGHASGGYDFVQTDRAVAIEPVSRKYNIQLRRCCRVCTRINMKKVKFVSSNSRLHLKSQLRLSYLQQPGN